MQEAIDKLKAFGLTRPQIEKLKDAGVSHLFAPWAEAIDRINWSSFDRPAGFVYSQIEGRRLPDIPPVRLSAAAKYRKKQGLETWQQMADGHSNARTLLEKCRTVVSDDVPDLDAWCKDNLASAIDLVNRASIDSVFERFKRDHETRGAIALRDLLECAA